MTQPDPREVEPHADQEHPSASTGAPEEAATGTHHPLATHGDPSLRRPSRQEAARHVQWVRPTDVAARAGAVVLDKSAEVNRHARQVTLELARDGAAHLRRALARREAALSAEAPAPGAAPARRRQGVSR